ncbi:MAG: proline--tRNA ligase [Mycoplasmatota bacterium]|mgnify:CR=1 FL=1|nr:proline--tRNA ligase [Mycoplasmatota bacterium]
MKNEAITSRDVDFAKWYTDVVKAAKLCDYSNVKGCVVFEPAGYAIWERMQSVLDGMFKESGHSNVYMPLLIPESLMKKEGELINGFAPEVAWVTHGGQNELEERLCVRPTSETLFSDYYSNVVKSYRDLPLKYNQWCSVMRWEKTTRPFLRSREFLWQEGHTVHASSEEAEAETRSILETYIKFFEEYLAIPVISGRKTEKEKFAGAEYSLTVEALMYNGIALQSGTSHYFGQKFAKAYDISFVNKDNKQEYAYQTSWGVTTRMIGALIMVHSDDFGLVLPPKIAPKQVVIVPIGNVEERVNTVYEALRKSNISVYIDNSSKSPGFKFKEAEVNGVPVRIEIGERDLKRNVYTVARRDTQEKQEVSVDEDIVNYVKELMNKIQTNLYQTAKKRRDAMTYEVETKEEMKEIINNHPGFIIADWCGDTACEVSLKEIGGLKSRCILEDEKPIHKCVACGKEAKHRVVWGIQY